MNRMSVAICSILGEYLLREGPDIRSVGQMFSKYHILVAAHFSHFFPLIICLSGQNLYGADEPAGLPLQLHEEAALHRAGEDAGGRHRHHHEVHPLRPMESHG